jgi:CBS domain-containing protein
MHATAIVVDVARIFALSKGIDATNTRTRLEQVGQSIGLSAREYESWVTAFEFMQTLRLNIQIQGTAVADNPNLIDLASFNDIDRSILKESLKTIRQLQQRLELDYAR